MLGAQTPYGLHEGIPEELLLRLQRAGKKPRQAVLRDLIQDLCRLRPFTANELSALLGGRDAGELKRLHLKPMRNAGILTLLFPESEKHPHQAYLVADQDKKERARDT
jgi:ATP-dependent DNA helicase RecG